MIYFPLDLLSAYIFTEKGVHLLTREMDVEINGSARDQNERVGTFTTNCDMVMHTHTHMHAAVKTSEGIEVVLHKRENL